MNESTAHHPEAVAPTRTDRVKPLVSVVIVSWTALKIVQECLPSVVASSYSPLEIIFADNASTDGSAEWVEAEFPHVTVIRHPENWAFCRGNNEAVKKASGKYVVLLNNDVEVPADWLQPMVDVMEADDSIGAVQPKLLDRSDPLRFEYAGASGGFLDRNGYPFTRGRVFFSTEVDNGQYNDRRNIFWASGAAIVIRRQLYERLGGLDERLFMHMEEIDFCWRLKREGFRIVCEPASYVYHIGGASLAQGAPQKVFLNFRNNLLVLYKNMPRREWPWVLAKRIFLDGIAVFRALIVLRPAESIAILRAFGAAHSMKRQFTNDRPSSEGGSDEIQIRPGYRGNIVIDYFLKRRRRFADLPDSKFID